MTGHLHALHAGAVLIHIICCGLPAVLSVTNLAFGAGLFALHEKAVHVHEFMHDFELPLLAVSGAMMLLALVGLMVSRNTGRMSWALFLVSAGIFGVNAAVTLPHALSH